MASAQTFIDRPEVLITRTVSRRHLRYPSSQELRLQWHDDGCVRFVDASTQNASAKGLKLWLGEPIPVAAAVSFEDETRGVRGVASVRYCRFANGKYEAGLEVSEPATRPAYSSSGH